MLRVIRAVASRTAGKRGDAQLQGSGCKFAPFPMQAAAALAPSSSQRIALTPARLAPLSVFHGFMQILFSPALRPCPSVIPFQQHSPPCNSTGILCASQRLMLCHASLNWLPVPGPPHFFARCALPACSCSQTSPSPFIPTSTLCDGSSTDHRHTLCVTCVRVPITVCLWLGEHVQAMPTLPLSSLHPSPSVRWSAAAPTNSVTFLPPAFPSRAAPGTCSRASPAAPRISTPMKTVEGRPHQRHPCAAAERALGAAWRVQADLCLLQQLHGATAQRETRC